MNIQWFIDRGFPARRRLSKEKTPLMDPAAFTKKKKSAAIYP